MSSTGRITLKHCFIIVLLVFVLVGLSAPSASFSQESKKEISAFVAKAAGAVSARKSGADCGKSVTRAQLYQVAVKLREFQAKQQAKIDRSAAARAQLAVNRKP